MTKRRVIVKQLLAAGFVLKHGANHDKFVKGSIVVTLKRHREIDEKTTMKILRDAGLR